MSVDTQPTRRIGVARMCVVSALSAVVSQTMFAHGCIAEVLIVRKATWKDEGFSSELTDKQVGLIVGLIAGVWR
jgi:hypothetical protein